MKRHDIKNRRIEWIEDEMLPSRTACPVQVIRRSGWVKMGLAALLLFTGLQLEARQRPRVGLALGGGGARGFAHLGVLEWLEEHRVPIDYISGTSMGGLIGGLYASGRSPAQIRRILEELQWERLFRAEASFRDLTFRRKEDRKHLPSSIQLGWQNGLSVREALIPGQEIGLLIDRLLLGYGQLETFDLLPTPFRCVAVDLISGEKVVLEKGSLARALNATMAIPGVFSPVQIENRLLVDGGLLDNLPTRALADLGSDIVVAVDVASPLRDRASIRSLFEVLDQSLSVVILENVEQSRQAADLVIAPQLDPFTGADFDAWATLAERGWSAADQRQVFLSRLSVSESEWAEYVENRRLRQAGVLPHPNRVEARGADATSNRTIEAALSRHADEPLDVNLLEEDLNRIYGWGRFSRLDYELVGEPPGALLHIQALPKTGGSPLIQLGVSANNVETDDVNFSFRSRVTFLDIGSYGSEWRIDTSVGTNLGASSEYYTPVGRGFFLAPRVFATRAHSSLFSDGQRLAEYKESLAGAGLDLGWGFGRRQSEVRLGYSLGKGDSEVRIGDPLLPDVEGTVSRAYLGWRYDDRDDSVVPRRGFQVEWGGSYFFQSPGSESGFSQTELKWSFFQPLASSSSLFFRAGGGTTFSKTAPPLQQFRLGGPFRLGAFGRDEFRGSRYLLASPGYLHELLPLPLLVGNKLYATVWHEVGAVFEREEPRDFRNSFTLGVVANTVLGPFFLGSSWGEGGRNKFYFSLGHLF